MNIFDAINQRRSIKHFDPNHKMLPAEEKQLFDLAQQSPSSFNIQHWRIVKVYDKDLRSKIKEAAWNQAQVTEASLLLVICSDIKAWEKSPERYWETAPQNVKEELVSAIKNFYQGKEELQRDEAIRSAGLIAQTIMLAAKGLGYDSCPMIGFDAKKVANLINLPKDHVIDMMIAVGKALKPAREKGGYLPQSEIIIENRF